MIVRRIAPHEPAALRLLQASAQYIAALYPPESTYEESPTALAQPHVMLFGAFIREALLGCVALKSLEDEGNGARYGEIKRLFVDPAARRRGIARRLMRHVEAHALESGILVLRLETGIAQPESLQLYRSLGFNPRGPFGLYPKDPPDPFSVFLEKRLD